MLTFVIILSVIIIFIGRWYVRCRKLIKYLEKIPGPPPLPLIGNALELTTTTVLLPKFLEYQEKYGGIVKLYIGPIPSMLLITDYNFLEYILSSTKVITKAQQYEFLANWLGNGLLLANGDRWKKHRKILTPAFHFKILEQFIEIFETDTNILVEKLKKEVGKSSVNIYPYIKLCMLDSFCETAMGTSVNAQNDSESEYVHSVKTICEIIIQRMFNAFLQYKILYFFSKLYRKEKRAVKILHDYTDSVIKKRKSEFGNGYDKKSSGTKRKLAFLDLLLQENAINHTLNDQDIREEVDTFMFEGHDTTASGISFALYCLAENLEVQEKVVEELQDIFTGDKFRSVTMKDLQEMKYLELVIKETLRLYPSAPFFSRNVDEDFEYGGVTIPKGITLLIPPYGIHRNPEYFPEPEKFLPERFTAENAISRFPFAYIPFSAGPRNCIGQRYAMLEMKAVLCILLRHYKFFPADPKHNLVLSAETILLSSNGIRVRLEKRKF